jgi:hypothetical protein
MPCGAPLTGEAPDVMTYDRATGTQVFVGGKGQTEVSAFNRETGSSAALRGDLSRPGVTESCAVDKLSGDAYRVSSQGPGDMQVTGRTGETGERWAFRAPDGSTQYWDPRADNRCFRARPRPWRERRPGLGPARRRTPGMLRTTLLLGGLALSALRLRTPLLSAAAHPAGSRARHLARDAAPAAGRRDPAEGLTSFPVGRLYFSGATVGRNFGSIRRCVACS